MVRGVGIAIQLVALSIFLAACGETGHTPIDEVRKDPVVVFAAFEDDSELRELMASYTEASGVRVIIRRGGAQRIVDELIENKISPPADVLMTHSVVDVWRAAEEGALRAIQSESIQKRLPAWSQDPDNLWASTDFRTAVVIYDAATVFVDDATGYASLAESQFEGGLCMSSSINPINQVVIAMLIDELGVRETQTIVRGWMKNLAAPVFRTESEVLAEIATGLCKIGLVSSAAAAATDLPVHFPAAAFADVDGIGIGRHASNPAGALALLEWLIARSPETNIGKSADVSKKNVGLVGWHQDDVVLLAERVQYH